MATETYRFQGSGRQGEVVSRLITKGSSTNPEEWVDVGGEIDLDDEQVAGYRKAGLKFRKSSEPDDDAPKGASSDDSSGDQPQQTSGGEVGSTKEPESGDKPEATQSGTGPRKR